MGVEEFMEALGNSTKISYFRLVNAGLSGKTDILCRLLQAMEHLQGPWGPMVYLEEYQILDPTVFQQLLTSLSRMTKTLGVNFLDICETRSHILVDLNGTSEESKEQRKRLVDALHTNTETCSLVLDSEGKDACDSKFLKDDVQNIMKRNKALHKAEDLCKQLANMQKEETESLVIEAKNGNNDRGSKKEVKPKKQFP